MGYRTCLKYVIFAKIYVIIFMEQFFRFLKVKWTTFFISAVRCRSVGVEVWVHSFFTLNYHCVQSSEQKSAGQFCNSAQNSYKQFFRKEHRTVREIFLHQHTEHSSYFWFLTLVQHPNKKGATHLHENFVNQDFRKYIMMNSSKLVTLSCPFCKTTILEKD